MDPQSGSKFTRQNVVVGVSTSVRRRGEAKRARAFSARLD